jgi:hypothetical protein
MKCGIVVCITLALVFGVWLTGCSARSKAAAPSPETTGSPAEGHDGGDLESNPASPTGSSTVSPDGEARAKPAPGTPAAGEESAPAQPTHTAGGTNVASGEQRLVELAEEDLARRLDLSVSQIRLMSIEAVEWPDASLGCPQPGMMYSQVVTPGFLIVLEAAGQTYEYHTDRNCSVVMCQGDGPDVVPLMPVAPHGVPGKPEVPSE